MIGAYEARRRERVWQAFSAAMILVVMTLGALDCGDVSGPHDGRWGAVSGRRSRANEGP